MATVAETLAGQGSAEPRFLLYGIGWQGYETMLRLVGNRAIRMTYDRGNLELMSPSQHHERFKTLIGILIQAIAEELDIPCVGLGSTTWRREVLDRGLEPDECFYLYERAEEFKDRTVELGTDPPPDLAVEIDVTRSSLDRQGIYAALGVPEVWRYDGASLRVIQLRGDGTYEPVDSSPSFPFLPLDEVARRLLAGQSMTHGSWGRDVRAWVRDVLAPRYQGPPREPVGGDGTPDLP